MKRFISLIVVVWTLGFAAIACPGQVTFFGNQTVTVDTNIDPLGRQFTEVGIGFLVGPQNPNSPHFPNSMAAPATVTVVPGGVFPATLTQGIVIANGSTLNVAGGEVDPGNTFAFDTSTVTVSSNGALGAVSASDRTTVMVTSGTVGGIGIFDNASALISGGNIHDFATGGNAMITMTGGSVGQVQAGGGTVNITGGTVTAAIECNADINGNLGHINISTPVSATVVSAHDGGAITLSGGGTVSGEVLCQVFNPAAPGGPPSAFLTGVQISGIVLCLGNGATINLSGGSVNADIIAGMGGTVSTSAAISGSISTSDDNTNVSMTGGSVGTFVKALDSSVISVSGGSVAGTAFVQDHASIDIGGTGSVAGGVQSSGNGNLNLTGGTIGGIDSFDSSTINISGGVVNGFVNANQSSTVFVNGGALSQNLAVLNSAVAFITDGTLMGGVATLNSGTLQMSGGSITSGGAKSEGGSTLALVGGSVSGDVDSQDNSTLQIGDSVTVLGNVTSHDQSRMFIAEASIFGNVDAFATSNMVIDGSIITGTISVHDSAVINLNGKILTAPPSHSILALADTAVTGNEIFVYDNGTLEINGLTFNARLLDPMNDGGMFSEYQLAGTFADGSSFPDGLLLFVQNGTGASFKFVAVPEPMSAGFIAAATAVALLRRGRRR